MFNFIRFCEDHRVPFLTSGHHHCHQGWIQTHCPQCTNASHGWHLGFSISGGNLNCWRCGSIKRERFVAEVLHISEPRAREVLREYDDGRRKAGEKEVKRRKRTIEPLLGAAPLLPAHKRYLIGRGFDPDKLVEEWELFGIGSLGDHAWRWRVCFPIKNEKGDTVSWGGRAIGDADKRKYYLTPDDDCLEDPRTMIYGIHRALLRKAMVVEGPADLWRMGPGTLATLGCDWREEQARRLAQFSDVYILYDADPHAQRRARSLAERLSVHGINCEIVTGFYKDPGGMKQAKADRFRRKLLGREAQ